jgi:hypothetical protein
MVQRRHARCSATPRTTTATSDHKSMWMNSNVTKLLTEIAALERAFGVS